MNARPVAVTDAILTDAYRLTIYMCYAFAVSAANATSQTAPAADARIGVGEALISLTASAVRWARRDMSLTSLATLATLDRAGPQRITDLARVEGVAQPSMTVLVGNLERDGFVTRTIMPTSPPQVEYALTGLGQSLSTPVIALGQWACEHIDHVDEAQRQFDDQNDRV